MAKAEKGKATEEAAKVRRFIKELPFEFENLALVDLTIDHRYQREAGNRAKKIATNLNPLLLGCLVVNLRDQGREAVYATVDGQARLIACRDLITPPFKRLPCMVFTGLTPAQEAELFCLLQDERKSLKPFDKFKAKLFAKDRRATQINQYLVDHGFHYATPQDRTSGAISAIYAIEKSFGDDGTLLDRMLNVVEKVWGPDDRQAVSSMILVGLRRFCRYVEGKDTRIIKAMRTQNTSPQQIIAMAQTLAGAAGGRSGGTGASGMAPFTAEAISHFGGASDAYRVAVGLVEEDEDDLDDEEEEAA
jgi:hypothetical protein